MHNPSQAFELLARATAAKNFLESQRSEYRKQVDALKQQRERIFVRATEFDDDSLEMHEFHQQLDLIDKHEFELHDKFRTILKRSDAVITKTVNEIVELKFGPNWHYSDLL